MALLKIYTSSNTSGVDLTPSPKNINVSIMDLDSDKTTRNAKGFMTRDIIRKNVRKLSIEFPILSRVQMKVILDHFNASDGFTASDSKVIPKGFIYLEYADPFSTTAIKKVFYITDRSTPLFHMNLKGTDGNVGVWEGLSFELIER
jgi:hypothetical protein